MTHSSPSSFSPPRSGRSTPSPPPGFRLVDPVLERAAADARLRTINLPPKPVLPSTSTLAPTPSIPDLASVAQTLGSTYSPFEPSFSSFPPSHAPPFGPSSQSSTSAHLEPRDDTQPPTKQVDILAPSYPQSFIDTIHRIRRGPLVDWTNNALRTPAHYKLIISALDAYDRERSRRDVLHNLNAIQAQMNAAAEAQGREQDKSHWVSYDINGHQVLEAVRTPVRRVNVMQTRLAAADIINRLSRGGRLTTSLAQKGEVTDSDSDEVPDGVEGEAPMGKIEILEDTESDEEQKKADEAVKKKKKPKKKKGGKKAEPQAEPESTAEPKDTMEPGSRVDGSGAPQSAAKDASTIPVDDGIDVADETESVTSMVSERTVRAASPPMEASEASADAVSVLEHTTQYSTTIPAPAVIAAVTRSDDRTSHSFMQPLDAPDIFEHPTSITVKLPRPRSTGHQTFVEVPPGPAFIDITPAPDPRPQPEHDATSSIMTSDAPPAETTSIRVPDDAREKQEVEPVAATAAASATPMRGLVVGTVNLDNGVLLTESMIEREETERRTLSSARPQSEGSVRLQAHPATNGPHSATADARPSSASDTRSDALSVDIDEEEDDLLSAAEVEQLTTFAPREPSPQKPTTLLDEHEAPTRDDNGNHKDEGSLPASPSLSQADSELVTPELPSPGSDTEVSPSHPDAPPVPRVVLQYQAPPPYPGSPLRYELTVTPPVHKALDTKDAAVKEEASSHPGSASVEVNEPAPPCYPTTTPWTLHFSDTDKSRALRRSPHSAEIYQTALVHVFTSGDLADLFGKWKALRRSIATATGRVIEAEGEAMDPKKMGLGMMGMKDDQNFHFFREGVTPMWEDHKCAMGGKIMFAGKADTMDALFFEIILLLLSDRLSDLCPCTSDNYVVGTTISRRANTCRVEIWLGGSRVPPRTWIDSVHNAFAKEFPNERVYAYKAFHPSGAPAAAVRGAASGPPVLIRTPPMGSSPLTGSPTGGIARSVSMGPPMGSPMGSTMGHFASPPPMSPKLQPPAPGSSIPQGLGAPFQHRPTPPHMHMHMPFQPPHLLPPQPPSLPPPPHRPSLGPTRSLSAIRIKSVDDALLPARPTPIGGSIAARSTVSASATPVATTRSASSASASGPAASPSSITGSDHASAPLPGTTAGTTVGAGQHSTVSPLPAASPSNVTERERPLTVIVSPTTSTAEIRFGSVDMVKSLSDGARPMSTYRTAHAGDAGRGGLGRGGGAGRVIQPGGGQGRGQVRDIGTGGGHITGGGSGSESHAVGPLRVGRGEGDTNGYSQHAQGGGATRESRAIMRFD